MDPAAAKSSCTTHKPSNQPSHLVPVHPDIASGTRSMYSQEELKQINPSAIPQHVAIIPDGNRRWAASQNSSCVTGYAHGAHTLIETALAAKELGIKWLTVYSFSTENWKRPHSEIAALMELFELHLRYYTESLIKASIRLNTIGNLSLLPQSLQEAIQDVQRATSTGKELFTLTLAMNYGGRDELIRSFRRLLETKSSAELLSSFSEEMLSQSLDTSGMPDPDLIIRTSGESRLSNFLLWQSSYSEVYIEKAHWPDFTSDHFLKAILDYQSRERRLGGNSTKK